MQHEHEHDSEGSTIYSAEKEYWRPWNKRQTHDLLNSCGRSVKTQEDNQLLHVSFFRGNLHWIASRSFIHLKISKILLLKSSTYLKEEFSSATKFGSKQTPEACISIQNNLSRLGITSVRSGQVTSCRRIVWLMVLQQRMKRDLTSLRAE